MALFDGKTFFDGSAFYVPIGFGPMVRAAFQRRLDVTNKTYDKNRFPTLLFSHPEGKFSGMQLSYYSVSTTSFLTLSFVCGFMTAKKAAIELDRWAVVARGYDEFDSSFRPETIKQHGAELMVFLSPKHGSTWVRIPLR